MTISDHIREIRKHLDEIERPYLGGPIRASVTVGKEPSVPKKKCPTCKGKGGSFYGSEPPPPGAHGSWRYCKRCNGTGKVVVT